MISFTIQLYYRLCQCSVSTALVLLVVAVVISYTHNIQYIPQPEPCPYTDVPVELSHTVWTLDTVSRLRHSAYYM